MWLPRGLRGVRFATAAAPGEGVTLPVRDALAQLVVSDEDRTGYERTRFKHWVDADKDGCNTRAEVLKAESLIAPEQGVNCKLSGGQWYSPYDDRYIAGPSGEGGAGGLLIGVDGLDAGARSTPLVGAHLLVL